MAHKVNKLNTSCLYSRTAIGPESEFVNPLGAQESIPDLAGRYDNPI
jgi:hypothetical protein